MIFDTRLYNYKRDIILVNSESNTFDFQSMINIIEHIIKNIFLFFPAFTFVTNR